MVLAPGDGFQDYSRRRSRQQGAGREHSHKEFFSGELQRQGYADRS
jgi:hypothetical protein